MGFSIRPLTDDDRPWVIELLRARWAGEVQVAHGKARDASALQGFAAFLCATSSSWYCH